MANTELRLPRALIRYRNAWGGDSGSPMYYQNKAYGILVANDCDGCTNAYYTHIRNVEIYFNVQTQIATP